MLQLQFRFYAELNDFLAPQRRQVPFGHVVKDQAAIKDVIEALGVPHPEVDLILVNGEPVDFGYLIQDGDCVSVYPKFQSLNIAPVSPVSPEPLVQVRFVLDVHLGKLATYLRLLGFDALYRNDYTDEALAQLSSQEQRVLLTQDRGLLKRSMVTYGYIVRSHDPEQQVREVLGRFTLHHTAAPLARCPRCNGQVVAVAVADVAGQRRTLSRQRTAGLTCPASRRRCRRLARRTPAA